MDRNPISDMEAAAAMPGLEQLADALLVDYKTRRSQAEVVSYLIFLAGRNAFASANAFDSALLCTGLWENLRASAATVGRELPAAPPTFDKLRHFRDRLPAGAIARLAAAFTEISVPLARAAGMLDPAATGPWDRPAPGNVIYGDGSVFAPLSGVSVDEHGEVHGSRAKTTPRLTEVFEGKDGKNADAGLPLAVVGVHGRKRWQRAVLGVQMFFDRNEIGASMDIFRQVAELSGGGATHVVYDRLLSGLHLEELLHIGMIPVVAMKQARTDSPYITLPEELQKRGYATKRKPAANKDKAGSYKGAPKSRLAFHLLRTVEHPGAGGTCFHELWALDGAVVSVEPNTTVSLDATVVECRSLEWSGAPGNRTATGVYTVPCRHGSITARIELSGSRPGRLTNGRRPSMADWVRPIPEVSDAFSRLSGMRSDVESAFAHLKSRLPKQRAASLAADHFVLDIVGASLLINAVLWDVHIAIHTECARLGRAQEAKRALRR